MSAYENRIHHHESITMKKNSANSGGGSSRVRLNNLLERTTASSETRAVGVGSTSRLRRSATTSTCLGRAQQRGNDQMNSQWDLSKNNSMESRKNMFLQDFSTKVTLQEPTANATATRKPSPTAAAIRASPTSAMKKASSTAAMTRAASSASNPSLKSCLSVPSHQESLQHSWKNEQQQPPMKKNVSFSSIEIREHPVAIGDNPSVSRGPPLSLDWYNEETCTTKSFLLQEYEQHHQRPARPREDIVLSGTLRESLLRELAGATTQDLVKANNEVIKVKKERMETAMQGPHKEQKQLALEKAKHKFQRLVGTKKSTSKEQKELWTKAAKYSSSSLAAIPEKAQSLPILAHHSSHATSRMKNAIWTMPVTEETPT